MLQSSNIKYVPKKLSDYYYRNVDDYYIAFSKSIKTKPDITPFVEFMVTAAVESLQEIKDSIVYYIRLFSLRDLYSLQRKEKFITKRQFDLLSLLLDNPAIEFSLKDVLGKNPYAIIYRNVSAQTARRDLKKLTESKFLDIKDGNRYTLNLRVLG